MGRMPFQARSKWALLALLSSSLAAAACGCTSPVIRFQSPDDEPVAEESHTRVIGDIARPWGLRKQLVQNVGLVTNLDKTGSDPAASRLREILLDDMKRRNVEGPNRLLALPSTSLVIARVVLPPGTQKGDRLDVEVAIPDRSTTESLRNGWLMQTRLQEMALLGDRIRTGQPLALAAGAVVVNTMFQGESDGVHETRGRVLGGAVATESRSLGLMLTSEHHSVRAAALIGAAVNRRFHTFDRGSKRGVATPKRDSFIELAVHSRYRNNLIRYFRVIQAIPLSESPSHLIERLSVLEQELLEPRSTLSAAVKLEAIGQEALPVLRIGLTSSSPMVRFASAEALAYMDQEDAIPHLAEAARDQPAFRWHSITALGSMVSSDARSALAELMHETSDETRYGSFRAIMESNPRDPAVQGEILDDTLALHEIRTNAEPLVHIRRTERPEIAIFAAEIRVSTPAVILAGKRILAKSSGSDRFKVTRFGVGEDDKIVHCSNNLSDLIRTIVKVGGSYTDVVAAITHAKQTGILSARVKFDALPKPGREYDLEAESSDGSESSMTEAEASGSEDEATGAGRQPDDSGVHESTGL